MKSFIFETVEFREALPVNAYITSIQNSSFHWHYEYELITILKGEISIRYNSRLFVMRAGDILLINSKEIHEIRCAQGDNICIFIQFDPSLFQRGQKKDTSYSFFLNSVLDEVSPKKEYSYFVKQTVRVGQNILREDERGYYRTLAEVYTLVADLMDYTEYDLTIQVKRRDDAEFLIEMVDYLREHLRDMDVNESLCHKFGLSEKTVHRYCKLYTGMSVKELLDSLRLDRAKHLLKSTDKSAGFIIDECGFGSEKTFYRKFRQDTGVTPKEYRERELIQQGGGELKGYLAYEKKEAIMLMKKMLEE